MFLTHISVCDDNFDLLSLLIGSSARLSDRFPLFLSKCGGGSGEESREITRKNAAIKDSGDVSLGSSDGDCASCHRFGDEDHGDGGVVDIGSCLCLGLRFSSSCSVNLSRGGGLSFRNGFG